MGLVAAAATSCVYDFDPEVEGEQGLIVIEGDILAGEMTYVDVSLSQTLSDKKGAYHVQATVWVEQKDGTKFTGYRSGNGYYIDTRKLDKTQQCRLCVVNNTYGSYYSDWLDVLVSPPITDITYKITEDGEYINFYVSTGSDGSGSGYYRWTASEAWEYMADYYATHYFDVKTLTINPYEDGENTYYCWGAANVSSLMIGTTAKLKEDKLEDAYLYSLHNADMKISYVYSMNLVQRAITKEAYVFWETLQKNSDNVGGLFSPQPSEMRGNIHCEQDPNRLVLGYISASSVTTKRAFFFDKDTRFYKKPKGGETPEPEEIKEEEWKLRYIVDDYRVYTYVESEEELITDRFTWLPRRCVDCTYFGGTKQKPDYWPTYDK